MIEGLEQNLAHSKCSLHFSHECNLCSHVTAHEEARLYPFLIFPSFLSSSVGLLLAGGGGATRSAWRWKYEHFSQ